MLPLGDLIRDLDVRLVAGEAGLENAVRWVHISELEDPTPWLSGGELLLTTGMRLLDAGQQRAFVRLLAGHGLAGLGLGTGFAHQEVPEALREEAAELGFPLVEVPYEVPFIAVTEKAASHLVNEHYAVLQRALSAHERLERIVLSERGLDGVAEALASLIGGPALIFDARGNELVRRTHRQALDDDTVEELRAELRRRIRDGARRGYAPGGELEGRALALPVVRTPPNGTAAAGRPPARLAGGGQGGRRADRVRPPDAAPGGDDRGARAAAPPRRRRHRAPAGRRPADRAGVRRADRPRPGAAARAVRARRPRRRARAAAAARDQGRGRGGADHRRARRGAGRASRPAPARSRARCSRTGAGRRTRRSGSPSGSARASRARSASELPAGAGRAAPAGDLRRAFHEARCALEARALAGDESSNGSGPPLLATYRDLGSFQLLLSLQDDDALRLFCDSILSPIEEGEGAYGGELMRSLESFIECNGQWEKAARQLYCHRHTLRYRIRRVEELTGRSLDSARDRIDFWLALRGRELIT